MHHFRSLPFFVVVLLALPIVLLSGCASTHIPSDQYGQPRDTIRAVDALGTHQNPRAHLHLMLARDEMQRAEMLTRSGNPDAAKLALLRAQADASLALTLLRLDQLQAAEDAR